MKNRTIEEYYQVNSIYLEELYFLQVELLKLQKHIFENKLRLAILFEGRDTAGKGSAIARFAQFLNPRQYRVVALVKPTEVEKGQWYFQRYLKVLPDPGEIVFFDRSWYNRGVVEPVLGFCSPEEYELFMNQVNMVEKLLIDDGMHIVKFWFSIKEKQLQKQRLLKRISSPLEKWKVSQVDLLAQEKWEEFTQYKNSLFQRTHLPENPWIIIQNNHREESRIGAMRYLLSKMEYEDKSSELKSPDQESVFEYRPY